MSQNRTIAIGAVTSALAFTLSAGALAAGGSPTTVTVRVEGKAKTLLAPKSVKTHSGSITKGGAPAGACPATSAQGALDVATKGRWSGTFSTDFNSYFVTQILGDTESGKKAFWEILVNNVPATTGGCGIALHKGDQLLFAVVPSSGHAYPAALAAPATAHVGQAITVKVSWFNAKGKKAPLAHAKVGGAVTNSKGVATITPSKTGKLTLQATEKGYIRSAPVTVHVS
jgi:hypothetical protein